MLEKRNLLAVVVSHDPTTGLLDITGDGNSNQVMISNSGNQVQVTADGQDYWYNASEVSQIDFGGGNGDDTLANNTDINLNANGNSGNDTISSGNGDDYIHAGPGSDHITVSGGTNTLIGHDGDDTINGGSGVDTVFGGYNNDDINGGRGDDFIYGERGDDDIHGGAGNDTIFAFTGDDLVYGETGNDFIYGQAGMDELFGGAGIDRIRGGDGADELYGQTDADRLGGDGGADTLDGGNENDLIFGSDGEDTIDGGNGNDSIFAGADNDTVHGGDGNDVIRGNEGDDSLYGDDGNDRVGGDDGMDEIDGGVGADLLFGDAGDDTITSAGDTVVEGGAGDDMIDFSSATGGTATFANNFAQYTITENGDGDLVVTANSGTDGEDTLTDAEYLKFADGIQDAEVPQLFDKVVTIQPIIVSNSSGANDAEFFGNSSQEAEIMSLIDEIFYQAEIDIQWLTANTWDNSFANVGYSSSRPQSDLGTVIANGDSAGVGHVNATVIDMYFVEVSAGFSDTGENVANGLAFVGGNGITMHTGDNLPTFQSGREVVARVAAHEIAHNLGLAHVHISGNLMDDGDELNESQIATIRNSEFAKPV
jgi:hypothetical protein